MFAGGGEVERENKLAEVTAVLCERTKRSEGDLRCGVLCVVFGRAG